VAAVVVIGRRSDVFPPVALVTIRDGRRPMSCAAGGERGTWTRPVTEPVLYLLSFLRPSLLFCFHLCEGVVTVEYGYSGGHNNARTAQKLMY